jgi:hypothetical protein
MALLRAEGWTCNHKRVERIWRAEELKVSARQPKRGRLWLAGGSCMRLWPEPPNHVWAPDFVEDRTRDGRRFRMPDVPDEFTRECPAIRVGRQLRAADVIDVLSRTPSSCAAPQARPNDGRNCRGANRRLPDAIQRRADA